MHGTPYATRPIINSKSSLINSNAVQLYEYSVYGQVAASDPNHPNPFLFTGRRFDTDTGLYYYRARYYNPYIGRFLQTDPAGYQAGMNLYRYCGNSPTGLVDPFGAREFDPLFEPLYVRTRKFPALAIGYIPKSDAGAMSAASTFFNLGWISFDSRWGVESAHMEDDGITMHVRFVWHAWKTTDDKPVPPPLNLTCKDVEVLGNRLVERVITSDGIGLLTQWKFERIMKWSQRKVRLWPTRGGLLPHSYPSALEAALLMGHCDSPFHNCEIGTWEFGGIVFDDSHMNYWLEGYAMRHFNYWYRTAEALVLAWKNLGTVGGAPERTRDALWKEFYWFDKGWDYYRWYCPWQAW